MTQALEGVKFDADGHVKAVRYADLIHNICYWTTDIEGPHSNCN